MCDHLGNSEIVLENICHVNTPLVLNKTKNSMIMNYLSCHGGIQQYTLLHVYLQIFPNVFDRMISLLY